MTEVWQVSCHRSLKSRVKLNSLSIAQLESLTSDVLRAVARFEYGLLPVNASDGRDCLCSDA